MNEKSKSENINICENKDYYDVFGIKPNATDKEIKSAHRRLSKEYHPDSQNYDAYFMKEVMQYINFINSEVFEMPKKHLTYNENYLKEVANKFNELKSYHATINRELIATDRISFDEEWTLLFNSNELTLADIVNLKIKLEDEYKNKIIENEIYEKRSKPIIIDKPRMSLEEAFDAFIMDIRKADGMRVKEEVLRNKLYPGFKNFYRRNDYHPHYYKASRILHNIRCFLDIQIILHKHKDDESIKLMMPDYCNDIDLVWDEESTLFHSILENLNNAYTEKKEVNYNMR